MDNEAYRRWAIEGICAVQERHMREMEAEMKPFIDMLNRLPQPPIRVYPDNAGRLLHLPEIEERK